MWWTELLRCPVCGGRIGLEGRSLFCDGARRHCFDLAKEGYVNLASAKASGGGDDAALIAARTAFLSRGHYAPLARRVCELLREHIADGTVVDAGCGEGYYTARMAESGLHAFGLDLSKRGVRHAAKTAPEGAFYAVAGIFDLPVADGAADGVVSLFAPVCESEFLRVLRPGGVAVLVGAGPDHLLDLKKVLYENAYRNEPRADAPVRMQELSSELLSFEMELNAPDLQALFAMTPYFYRTGAEGRARLAALEGLSVGAQMEIRVFQKPL